MNIVKFWQSVAEKWNEEKKCGFCWAFGGALEESAIESYQIRKGEECCVHLFVTFPTFNMTSQINPSTSLPINVSCNDGFVLWALYSSKLGINNYNEIPNHNTEDSAWETIHYPIKSCLACDIVDDLCKVFNEPVALDRWYGMAVFKKYSNAYDGWRIEGMFKSIR